jgi:hypothetical protein
VEVLFHRYLQISGTFLACFSGFDCIPYGNIFGKYGHVEPGVGARESYPAFLIDLYSCTVIIDTSPARACVRSVNLARLEASIYGRFCS